MTAIARFFRLFSRACLCATLGIAWFAPPVYASETTCEPTNDGYNCTIWVNTFGEGPTFTFEITTDQTPVLATTYTSMTCDDWENAPHAYAADPHIWLYQITEVEGEETLTLIANDDDSAPHNDGSNMCWDSELNMTLDTGVYQFRADAYDTDYIGTYTLVVSGGAWTVPEPQPTPTPEPTLDCSQYEINVGKYVNSAEISFGQIVEVFVSQEALEDTCAYQLDSEIWVPVDDPAWANGDIFLSETPELPTPQPTPTPEPSPTPTPEPTPTPQPEPTPEPPPLPSPTPTPSPTPVPEPEPSPLPEPEPSPEPSPIPPAPTPPPVLIPEPSPSPEPITIDDIDWNDIDDIDWDDIDWGFGIDENDGEPIVVEDDFPEEFTFDDLPEINEEEFEEIEPFEIDEEPEELEEPEEPIIEFEETPTLEMPEDLDEEFIEEFEEGPPNEEDIYFDEATGEWEDDPDLELEEVDIEDLLEDDEQLEELIEELEADDVLEEILEDNEEFFEQASDEQLEELFEENAEIFNEADSETKSTFEEEVNVFAGGFDDYQADGQTITIEERRTVVAATAVVSATAIAVRPAPPTPTAGPTQPTRTGGPSATSGSSGSSSGGPTQSRRGRNTND